MPQKRKKSPNIQKCILIENYAGDFPLWLAPIQVRLLPVSDEQHHYALGVAMQLKQAGYRVEIDKSCIGLTQITSSLQNFNGHGIRTGIVEHKESSPLQRYIESLKDPIA